MSDARDIIQQLIGRLYAESSRNGFHFRISPYDSSGQNYLTADDGTFLGNLSNQYDSKSIFNQYGPYGSRYSATSIFNPYSIYGSRYSAESPFNRYTATPPRIYINGQYYGRLSANAYVADSRPVDAFLYYVLQQLNLLDDRMDDLAEWVSRL